MASGPVRFLIGMLVCYLPSIPASAQQSSIAINPPSTHVTVQLRALGIDLSERSLIEALSNSDSNVRILAALQLGQDRDVRSIPSIEYALSIEHNTKAHIGIVAALGSLHDSKGVEHLQTMCTDTSLPIADIFAAVQSIQIAGASSAVCAGTIVDSVNQAQYADYRADILSLLPTLYRDVPADKAERILGVLKDMVGDGRQQAAVRLGAGLALAEIGAPSSAEAIRSAISREKDPFVRSTLQDRLNVLEKKP